MVFVLSELMPRHIFFYVLAEDCVMRIKINKTLLFKGDKVKECNVDKEHNVGSRESHA